MTIKKAREILGDQAAGKTDEEVQKIIDTLQVLANIAIDTVLKMTPEQRKSYERNDKISSK